LHRVDLDGPLEREARFAPAFAHRPEQPDHVLNQTRSVVFEQAVLFMGSLHTLHLDRNFDDSSFRSC
jgi:hypothetical protein